MSITKQVIFIAKQDGIEQLKALLKDMVEPSKKEIGVIAYDIFQVINTPEKFIVIETWESEDALEGHRNTEHYKYYKAHFEVFCASKSSDEIKSL